MNKKLLWFSRNHAVTLARFFVLGYVFAVSHANAKDDQPLRGFNAAVDDLIECEASPGPDCSRLIDAQAAGATLIRLSFAKQPLIDQSPPYRLNQDNLKKMESLLNKASELGLRVVIDPHAMPGAARFTTLSRTDRLWTDESAQDALVALWSNIARRVKRLDQNDTVYAFDLINEPYDLPANAPLNALYKRLVSRIRQIDPDQHLILDFYNQHYWDDRRNRANFRPQSPQFYDSGDRGTRGNRRGSGRLLYSTHIYWPLDFTHQGISITQADGTVKSRPAGREWNNEQTLTDGAPWTREGLEKRLGGITRFAEKHGHWRMFIGEFSASACQRCAWDSRNAWERPVNGGDLWLTDVTNLLDRYNWSWAYHSLNGAMFWDAASPNLRWGHISYLLNR